MLTVPLEGLLRRKTPGGRPSLLEGRHHGLPDRLVVQDSKPQSANNAD